MLQQLINHSPDIKKLSDDGYEVDVKGGHILVHHIPYVNPERKIKFGTLVCPLSLVTPYIAGQPPDHTMHFCGDLPCNVDGNALTAIINSSGNFPLGEGIVANHLFSSKPKSGNYPNYYEKFRTYAEILSSQAKAIDPAVSTKPRKAN